MCEHCGRPVIKVTSVISNPPRKLSPCRHRYVHGRDLKMPFSKVKKIFGENALLLAQIWILHQEVYRNWTGDKQENPALREYNQTQKDILMKRDWQKEHQNRLEAICAPKESFSNKFMITTLTVGFFFTIGILYRYGRLDRLYQSAQDFGRKIAASRRCPPNCAAFHTIKKALPPCVHRCLPL